MKAQSPSGSTGLFLIIGDPVSHSLSPFMHNAAYKAAQLDYCMAAALVKEYDLAPAIAGIRALSIRGLAVTMPHKVNICSLLDELDPIAVSVGAVNTVCNTDGHLKGYNTDWLGILRPLEKRIKLAGLRVAIIGAGGAAQAAVYACSQSESSVTVVNRNVVRAKQLAERHNAAWSELAGDWRPDTFDVIINTTPVGMGEQRGMSPISLEGLSRGQLVFETIYAPRRTALVQYARSAGCEVITGDEMFLEQGAAQFSLHTGVEPPRQTMQQALPSDT